MPYVVFTPRFVTPMYFMDHQDTGFAISTDPAQAKVYDSEPDALIESQRLQEVSGMKTQIKNVQ